MREIKEIVAYLQSHGEEKITVAELDRRLLALGYKRDMDAAAVGPVKHLNDGFTYTGINYSVVEADTGISAFHYKDARRDRNFRDLQEMRRSVFCVVNGRILTV